MAEEQQSGIDYTKISEDIFKLINSARTDPEKFISKVDARYESYDSQNCYMSHGIKYQTEEGKTAVEDLLSFLTTLGNSPLKPLERSSGLDKAAEELATHNGTTGEISHQGKEGSTMESRVSQYGKWVGKLGECIGVQAIDGNDFVLNWLIDDGIEGRGDMKSILNGGFTKIGISTTKHKIHGIISVVVLAKNFWEFDADGKLSEEGEKANNTNPELLDIVPPEIKQLPDDAVGVDIKRIYIEDGGIGKTMYKLDYRLKDGTKRTEVKEYEGRM